MTRSDKLSLPLLCMTLSLPLMACGDGSREGSDAGPRDAQGLDATAPDGSPIVELDAGQPPRRWLPLDIEVTCAAFREGNRIWRVNRNGGQFRLVPPEGIRFATSLDVDLNEEQLVLRSLEEVEPSLTGRVERLVEFFGEGAVLTRATDGQIEEGEVESAPTVTITTTDIRVNGNMETASTDTDPWNEAPNVSWRAAVREMPVFAQPRPLLVVEETLGPLEGLTLAFDPALGLVRFERPSMNLTLEMCACEGSAECMGSCETCP